MWLEADQDGVRYTIEATNDFAGWDSVIVAELSPDDAANVQAALGSKLDGLDTGWQWRSVRTAGDLSSERLGFIRLNVSEIP